MHGGNGDGDDGEVGHAGLLRLGHGVVGANQIVPDHWGGACRIASVVCLLVYRVRCKITERDLAKVYLYIYVFIFF